MIWNNPSLRSLGLSLLAVLPLSFLAGQTFAAAQDPSVTKDEQFNGRWDIKTIGEHPRARWLEIENAGTSAPKGKFISAFGGDLNVIEEISIHNGTLRFGWTRQERPNPGAEPVPRKLIYTAKLENGKLQRNLRSGRVEPAAGRMDRSTRAGD